MGCSQSSLQHIPDAQELMEKTGFSAEHIRCLHDRFEQLDTDHRGVLKMEDFEAISELEMNPIKCTIIRAFFPKNRNTVDFSHFVKVLAHFQPTRKRNKNALKEPYSSSNRKLRFIFRLYDTDRDGKISKDELLQILQEMLGMSVSEEQLQCITDRAIQEADLDQDGSISFEEFKKSLEEVDIDQKMRIGFLS